MLFCIGNFTSTVTSGLSGCIKIKPCSHVLQSVRAMSARITIIQGFGSEQNKLNLRTLTSEC